MFDEDKIRIAFLEDYPYSETKKILKEAFNKLQVNGVLEVKIRNFDRLVYEYGNQRIKPTLMMASVNETIYGKNRKSVHSPAEIVTLLHDIGFKKIDCTEIITAVKTGSNAILDDIEVD